MEGAGTGHAPTREGNTSEAAWAEGDKSDSAAHA